MKLQDSPVLGDWRGTFWVGPRAHELVARHSLFFSTPLIRNSHSGLPNVYTSRRRELGYRPIHHSGRWDHLIIFCYCHPLNLAIYDVPQLEKGHQHWDVFFGWLHGSEQRKFYLQREVSGDALQLRVFGSLLWITSLTAKLRRHN